MKKLLLFAFSCCALLLNAQNFNAARHTLIDNTSNMVCINSKSYYAEYAGNDSINLVGVNGSGQTLFRTRILQTPAGTASLTVIRTLDKKIVVLSWHETFPCDVVSHDVFLTKCDTTGAIVFQSSVPLANTAPAPSGLVQYTDSSFYIAIYGATLLRYSKTGVYSSSLSTGYDQINALHCSNFGSLVITGTTGTAVTNALTSTAGVVTMQQDAIFTITKFVESSLGGLYGLSNTGIIQRYTPYLTAFNNTIPTLAAGIEIQTMCCRNDTLFCAGRNTLTGQNYYALLDDWLTPIYQQQSPIEGLHANGITVNNQNRVTVLSTGNSNDNRLLTYRNLNQMAISGSLTARHDIGVTSFAVNSIVGSSQMPWTTLATMSITAIVRNFGSDTVHDFYLNYKTSCGYSSLSKHRQTIAPNSFITVTTSVADVLSQIPLYNWNWPITKEICLSTSIPDFEADVQNSNDVTCMSLVFTNTGIHENGPNGALVDVFPNPFSSTFQVRSAEELLKLEVLNLTGQVIKSIKVTQPEISIDASEWAPGVYLLKAEGVSGTGIRKLVKN